ncbi:GT4 family glycosyltransferase PelF [Mesonia sp. MT50]|uniref:GT4 family glycosyltransferase PelF n=1 Tax=Mesonia profundi TaxID=3070998 RepID=A0ABU1A3X6_9FLAO|nr:GT4 family glycosyltransferase PelF [Mesonia profundi]MDQ7918413.1 GT4 family glycosyltransferase PelF [Mesonia profundi]
MVTSKVDTPLCNEIKNADYYLYSVNAVFESKPKYELSPNVKDIIQVPLWTPDEPYDYISYGDEYYKTVGRKEWTSDGVVNDRFIPYFEQLLEVIYSEEQDMLLLDNLFYELWLYFEDYDFKKTMQNKATWDTYVRILSATIVEERNSDATLLDMSIGLRWIYRFLIPLSIVDVPKVDICHLTISGFAIIPALISHYKHGSKIMVTEHGVFIRERLLAINQSGFPYFLKNLLIKFSETIARLAYYKSEVIASVNKFNQKWEKLYGAEEYKLKVIYNAVDKDVFKPLKLPHKKNKPPTVIALARIFDLKDILTMIKSCAIVVKEIPEVQFLVYGDNKAVPEYTESCERLIEELNLDKSFKLMGPKRNPHLIFPEGDISILTSISEGFPYTVIESMSCGVPVVATDVGGVSEALNEETGIICKPKNYLQIGEAVIKLLKDENLRSTMGVKCRERVLEHFTLEDLVKDYEQIYDQLGTKENV